MDPSRVGEDSPSSSEKEPIVDAVAATATAGDDTAPDANSAESSAAGERDAKPERSLLDVVREVVEPKTAAEDSSTTEGKTDGGTADAQTAKADGEDQPDDSKLPFHNHPRWKEVQEERATLREERDNLRPRAEQLDKITSFMDFHGLSSDEVGEGFEVMALLKSGDPASLQKALEWFEPRVDSLRETLGVSLPQDLREKVETGDLDEETAKELATARAKANLHERREEARTQSSAEAATAMQQRDAAIALGQAVQTWEEGVKKADPDYAKKAEMVEATVLAMAQKEGRPQTPEQAVELAKRAYDKVNSTFKGFAPRKGPVDTRGPASTTNARTTAAPTTLRDALKASLEGA